MNIPAHKICTRCLINKTAKHFRLRLDKRSMLTRLNATCTDCQKEKAAEYYMKVKDLESFKLKNRVRQKAYLEKNSDEIKRRRQKPEYKKKHAALNMKSYYRNRDLVNAKQKFKRQSPKYKAMMKAYRQKNKAKIHAQEVITKRRYHEKNRDAVTDTYVKGLLMTQTGIARNEIPPQLVKLKKIQILGERIIKQKLNEPQATSRSNVTGS